MTTLHKILGFERSKIRFNRVNKLSGNKSVAGRGQEVTMATPPQFSYKLRENRRNKEHSLLTHSILIFCCFVSISLSSCAPSSDNASATDNPPATNNPPPPSNYTSPVAPAHLSATFNGAAAEITAEITSTETGAAITIMGIENTAGMSADSGMLTITATGYTIDKTTLIIPNPAGTDETNVAIGEFIVTANDQAVTHRVTVKFLALSAVRLTITDANLDNSLTLTDADRTSETGIRVKPCEHFDLGSALSILAAETPVNPNEITLTPPSIASIYYDRTVDSTSNTTDQTVSVTVAGTAYDFMFPIIIQECTAAGLTQIEDSSFTPSVMAWNIDNDLRLNLVAELVNQDNSAYADDNYILTADIDLGIANAPWSETMSTSTTPNGKKGFTPIGTTIAATSSTENPDNFGDYSNSFKGNFNCNNKTVSNLYISNTVAAGNINNGSAEGLFGVVATSGVIKNCALVAVKIAGLQDVGGLVGLLNGGTISRSYTSGSISQGVRAGGIVGSIESGSVESSYSSVSITVTTDLGGVVGSMRSGNASITNSYATGRMESTQGTSDSNGGFVGSMLVGTIINSYSIGNVVSSATEVGGFAGAFAARITASYWDTMTSGRMTSGTTAFPAGTGRTTAQMQVAAPVTTAPNEVYVGWESSVWKFAAGKYPRLINVACANRQDNPDATECTSTLE